MLFNKYIQTKSTTETKARRKKKQTNKERAVLIDVARGVGRKCCAITRAVHYGSLAGGVLSVM